MTKSPGVTGAATERPLEGVAEDVTTPNAKKRHCPPNTSSTIDFKRSASDKRGIP